MKVAFYGTRGTMPVTGPDYAQFGGNTSCVLVTFSTGKVAILDAGTGIRNLGNDLLKSSHEQYDNISIKRSGKPFYDTNAERFFSCPLGKDGCQFYFSATQYNYL